MDRVEFSKKLNIWRTELPDEYGFTLSSSILYILYRQKYNLIQLKNKNAENHIYSQCNNN